MAHSHNHNHKHHSPEDSDFTLMVAFTINSLLTVFIFSILMIFFS